MSQEFPAWLAEMSESLKSFQRDLLTRQNVSKVSCGAF
jgi:hypothetical protein